jgi:spermidine/putrescine-binding protein
LKKVFGLLFIVFSFVLLTACDNRQKLYLLNWEEYINDDVIKAFEEEFNVKVVLKGATSNELMYNDIFIRSGEYDIAIPSDYMIQRLHEEDLLVKLDFDKLPNYDKDKIDSKLQTLRDDYFEGNQDYSVPYFWGTLGIMYNDSKAGVKELVEEKGWGVLFEDLPSGISVGMYDSSRDAVAAAELYKNIDLNTKDTAKLNEVGSLLKSRKYTMWGTDNLKESVVEGNLDIALVYSGDFFDQYYFSLEEGLEITYGLHVPTLNNNVWFDAMVIPKTSKNIDLAHAFINFFLDEDNAFENASYVGYCPTITEVYKRMLKDEDLKAAVTLPGYYPGEVINRMVYEFLGGEVALKMDEILNHAKIK